MRHALWVAWLRRPLGRALAKTLAAARQARSDPAARQALLEFAAGLPWALSQRREIPTALEQRVRALEQADSREAGSELRVPRGEERRTAAGFRTALFYTRTHNRLLRPRLASIRPDSRDPRFRPHLDQLVAARDQDIAAAHLAA